MAKSYDNMQGNPLNAKEHPDTILPDTSTMFLSIPTAISAGQYPKATPSLSKKSLNQTNPYE